MQDSQLNKTHVLMLMQLARLLPNADVNEVYNNAAQLMTQASNDFPRLQVKAITMDSIIPCSDESVVKKEEETFDLNRYTSTETSASQDEPNSHEKTGESDGIIINPEALLKQEHHPNLEDFLGENTAKTEEKSGLLEGSKKIAKQKSYFKIIKNSAAKSGNAEEPINCHKINRSKRRTRNKTWKTEEDAYLVELYEIHGPKWAYLGKLLGNKSGKQCRDRYTNTLKPGINFEEWTKEEENRILALMKTFGKKWCLIASNLPGRTENQVKNKYYYLKGLKYKGRHPQRKENENDSNSNTDAAGVDNVFKIEEAQTFQDEKIVKQANFINPSSYSIQGKINLAQTFQPQNQASAALFPQNFQKGVQTNLMLMHLMQARFNLPK